MAAGSCFPCRFSWSASSSALATLSRMSASPDATSPSSTSKCEGLGGPVGVAGTCSGGEGSSTCLVGSPAAVSCASGRLPEDMLLFSPSTAKGLVAGTGSAGFAEVDGGAVTRLGSIEEAGFENLTFFFFDKEGVTHSRAAGILKCGESRYRILKVDANVKGVLPREAAQAVKVPTTLEATELGRVMKARSCLGLNP